MYDDEFLFITLLNELLQLQSHNGGDKSYGMNPIVRYKSHVTQQWTHLHDVKKCTKLSITNFKLLLLFQL